MIRTMLIRFTKFILISTIVLIGPAVSAQYVPADEIYIEGEPINITLSKSETLTVTYRPGSNISEKEILKAEGATVTWTPRTAGIIALSTPEGPVQTISVRFSVYPISGFIILLLAAGILFGGAGFAAYKLFGKTTPEMLTDRPDT